MTESLHRAYGRHQDHEGPGRNAGGEQILTTTTAHARLLPAREAYDYEYFRARLADPALADAGVAIALPDAPVLAVPVGGVRRGGYASFGKVVDALEARALLDTLPGFPGVRVRWSPYRDNCHTVEWGEPAPRWCEEEGGLRLQRRRHS